MTRRSERVPFRVLLVAFVLVLAPDAAAFCRTLTEQAPADYDPLRTGKCFTGSPAAKPLFWRNACVGYDIFDPPSKKISYDDAADLLSIAFTRWTGATCPTEGEQRSRTSIDVRDLGPAYCDKVQHKGLVRNQNIVLFRDDAWRHGKTVLGLTTVSYAPDTGEIFGADMEINMIDPEPLALRDPVGEGYDFLSIATHEAGHFLGIAHSDVAGATMAAIYRNGQTFQRDLSPDDIQAICTVYRPDGYRSVLTGKIFQAPECDPTPRGGFTRSCEEPNTRPCAASSAVGIGMRPDGTALLALVAGALLRRRRGSR